MRAAAWAQGCAEIEQAWARSHGTSTMARHGGASVCGGAARGAADRAHTQPFARGDVVEREVQLPEVRQLAQILDHLDAVDRQV